MRPVIRHKNNKIFQDYRDARGDLINNFGEYCSYCETRLSSSLDVEHILPKSQFPDEEKNWENFCLACTNCNSIKKWAIERRWKDSWQHLHATSAKIAARSQFYWIDKDNTFRIAEYTTGGIVKVNSSLSVEQQQVAQVTIKMVGLDRIPNPDPQMKDRRWMNRREAWDKAERALQRLSKCNDQESLEAMRDSVIEQAISQGFFSVWMTVFQDDPEMLKRFIAAFPGTAEDCFDKNFKAIHRPKGRV